MARRPSGGSIRHKVAFDERVTAEDQYGNPVSKEFQEQFRVHGQFLHRGGSESVQAARLEGRQVLGVYVRSSSWTRRIKSDWQMRDVLTGTVYAINAVDTVTDRAWVYLTVESGSAT